MNVDAKPWYPGASTVNVADAWGRLGDDMESPELTTSSSAMFTQASSWHVDAVTPETPGTPDANWPRRHDPYRQITTPSSAVQATNSAASVGGISYDYSDAMYAFMRSSNLVDGPPTYEEFVGVLQPPQQPYQHTSTAVASSQPYRSAPFRALHTNTPEWSTAIADSDHHGVSGSGSHSSAGSGAATPRGPQLSSNLASPTAGSDERKPKSATAAGVVRDAALEIPRPRSRQSPLSAGGALTPATTTTTAAAGPPPSNPALPCTPISSPTGTRSGEGTEFPLPAPRSKRAAAPAPVSSQQQPPSLQPSHLQRTPDASDHHHHHPPAAWLAAASPTAVAPSFPLPPPIPVSGQRQLPFVASHGVQVMTSDRQFVDEEDELESGIVAKLAALFGARSTRAQPQHRAASHHVAGGAKAPPPTNITAAAVLEAELQLQAHQAAAAAAGVAQVGSDARPQPSNHQEHTQPGATGHSSNNSGKAVATDNAAVVAPTPAQAAPPVSHSKPHPKKKEEWKVVEPASQHSAKASRSTTTAASATTSAKSKSTSLAAADATEKRLLVASTNKFELASRRTLASHARGKDTDSDQDSDLAEGNRDERECIATKTQSSKPHTATVISSAAAKKQHKMSKKNEDRKKEVEEDELLDEIAAQQLQEQQQQQHPPHPHNNSSSKSGGAAVDDWMESQPRFMGFLRLNAFPTYTSLLLSSANSAATDASTNASVSSPLSPQHVDLLKSLHRANAEANSGDNTQSRQSALRRLLPKVTQRPIATSFPAVAVASLVEACDASLDVEQGFAHARQAMVLARAHRSQALELLSSIAYSRFCQKIIDGTDCKEELLQSLRIAVELKEDVALGWISLHLAVFLEVNGAFRESVCWHFLAARIGRMHRDARLECEALTHVAISAAAIGNQQTALTLVQLADTLRARRLSRAEGNRVVQNISQVYGQIGDLTAARQYYCEEMDRAKEQRDFLQASQYANSVAGSLRSVGNYEAALSMHHEEQRLVELCSQGRETDCLMGLAVTHKLLKNSGKARDYFVRCLRLARENGDQPTVIKCLAEVAELDHHDHNDDGAITRIAEALRMVDQTSPNDVKQFYLKVNMCEAEWKVLDILEGIYVSQGNFFDALRCGDAMRLPNTADATALLRKRQRKHAAQVRGAASHPQQATPNGAVTEKSLAAVTSRVTATPAQSAQAFLDGRMVDASLLRDMFHADPTSNATDPARVVALSHASARLDVALIYSLRWDDEANFFAYVVKPSPTTAGAVDVVAKRLELTPAAIQVLMGNHSALFNVLHHQGDTAEVTAEEDSRENSYFDTPLFPQRYGSTQLQREREADEEFRRLASDVDQCLEALYDAFLRPLEGELPFLCEINTPADSNNLPTVLVVGDGVVSMIPFPALRNSRTGRSVVDSCMTCKLPSLEHAVTIFAQRAAALESQSSPSPASSTAPQSRPIHASLITGSAVPSLVADLVRRYDYCGNGCSQKPLEWTQVGLHADSEVVVPDVPSRSAVMDEATPTIDVAQRLVESTLVPRQRNVQLSNRLVRSLLVDCPRGGPLVLDLAIHTDVKEEFSGAFVTEKGTLLATSNDVALAWNLSSFPAVIATRYGAYSSRAIHETGIPVYRALLLAGCQRLLVPTSVRSLSTRAFEIAAACAGAAANANSAADVSQCVLPSVHRAMLRLKAEGEPLTTWCGFTMFGLP